MATPGGWIVIHHTGDANTDNPTLHWQAIRQYHILQKGWDDIAYHMGVGEEPQTSCVAVYKGRSFELYNCHALGFNKTPAYLTIGIVLLGNYDLKEPSSSAWSKLKEIVYETAQKYAIPSSRIIGHRDVLLLHAYLRSGIDTVYGDYGGRIVDPVFDQLRPLRILNPGRYRIAIKTCPGARFDLTRFRRELESMGLPRYDSASLDTQRQVLALSSLSNDYRVNAGIVHLTSSQYVELYSTDTLWKYVVDTFPSSFKTGTAINWDKLYSKYKVD